MPHGRLTEFHSIPSQVEDRRRPRATGLDTLFDAAGLTPATFHDGRAAVDAAQTGRRAVEPGKDLSRLPMSWSASRPHVSREARFSSASCRRGRGRRAGARPPALSITTIVNTLSDSIGLLVSVVALLLTRRHFRSGRGDRTGAFRTASVTFVVVSAAMLLRAGMFAWLGVEWNRSSLISVIALYIAVTFWLSTWRSSRTCGGSGRSCSSAGPGSCPAACAIHSSGATCSSGWRPARSARC